jgi:hypothetical protein
MNIKISLSDVIKYNLHYCCIVIKFLVHNPSFHLVELRCLAEHCLRNTAAGNVVPEFGTITVWMRVRRFFLGLKPRIISNC